MIIKIQDVCVYKYTLLAFRFYGPALFISHTWVEDFGTLTNTSHQKISLGMHFGRNFVYRPEIKNGQELRDVQNN